MNRYRRNGKEFYMGIPSKYISYVYFGHDPQDGNYVRIRFKTEDPWDVEEEATITFFGNAYGGSDGTWLLAKKDDSNALASFGRDAVDTVDKWRDKDVV